MVIVTGNKNKSEEIKKFVNIPVKEIDFKEIKANNPTLIALYKAKEAYEKICEDVIIEDVTMYVNNRFYPDIKVKQEELKEDDYVELVLTIAKTENGKVKIVSRRLKGVIHKNRCQKYDFGFDNVFFVLDKECLGDYKQKHPLRNIYREVYLNDLHYDYIFDLNSIKDWEKDFQNA